MVEAIVVEPALLVVIGSSTGGPDALADLLPRMPANLPASVLVAQHMPASFTGLLAHRLAFKSVVAIREAEDGAPLTAGTVLLAPGDRHLEVDGPRVKVHRGPPEHSCRPSVDVLFRSAAKAELPVLAVVLTGMGKDGLDGARLLREGGAQVFVQDELSSVVWGMPGLIARAGLATLIATIPEIAVRVVAQAERAAHRRRTS